MQLRGRTRALLAAGLLAITSGFVLGATGVATAGAETMTPPAGDPSPSTGDTATTEVAALTTTDTECAMAGAPTFDNGRGGSSPDLHKVNLEGGDTLTMSWTAGPGCDTANGWPTTVTLAVYQGATGYDFDSSIDQTLLDDASCGGAAGPCAVNDGVYSLSLVMRGEECFAQVDAVHGDALPVVGPHGGYYGFGQEVSRLISAGTLVNKVCGPTTTPTEAPTTTTTAAPTTTQAPTTTTTAAPTTTTTAEAPAATLATTAAVVAPAAVGVEAATVARQLPVTGAHTGVLVLLGASLILLGAAALVAVRAQARAATAG